VFRTTISFAAGVVVGAFGRDALPKLEEHLPKLKEQCAPLLATALAGARDAAEEAVAHVARTVGSVQDAMAQHPHTCGETTDRVSPAA
jgi:hypothetical protein